MLPVGKVILPFKLFDAQSTSCEWMQCCISCSIRIDMSVTNNAKIFEGVCVGKLCAIIEERGHIFWVRVEAHHLRVLYINSERISLCVRSYFVQHGKWLGLLDKRETASANSIWVTRNLEYQ